MRRPKFNPGQQVFYRHVVEDEKLFVARVIEYINTRVAGSRYDEKTDTYYYRVTHPIHSDILVEVPEYDLFSTYKEAVTYDRFI